jgi:lysophospholipase L1-like esterase
MLDSSGKPRSELFRADSLHLNAEGYALWKQVIGPHVH